MKERLLYEDIHFTSLKRKIYLILLPIFVLAFGTVWISLKLIAPVSFLNNFTFSILCFGLTFGFALLLVKPNSLRKVEILISIITATLFLIRILESIMNELGVVSDHLGNVSYWMPLLYFLYFFTFRGKTALLFSASVFLVTLGAGIFHIFFSGNVNADTIDTMIQFYFSNVGCMVALYYFQHIIEGYLQAQVAEYNANTDYLTGLPNRRKMDTLLQEEMDKATEKGLPLTVILLDIDDFKKINDTFGHEVGDQVLVKLATTLKGSITEPCHFGRWGGEEFLIIAVNSTLQEGKELAERVKISLNQLEDGFIRVTCSFGVSQYVAQDLSKDLLKRADEALYEAKETGKNRVCIL